MRGAPSTLQPSVFRQVRRTAEEALCNALLHRYHELGPHATGSASSSSRTPVFAGDRVVAALVVVVRGPRLDVPGPLHRLVGRSQAAASSSAGLQDKPILDPPVGARAPLGFACAGTLGAATVGGLATACMAMRSDFLETVADPTRHRGTCYRAG